MYNGVVAATPLYFLKSSISKMRNNYEKQLEYVK